MIRHVYHSSQHCPEGNEQCGDFVSRTIWGIPGRIGPHMSMAVLDGDDLIAATVYHNMDEDAGVIELSSGAKSKRWLQPHIIRAMFWLPFEFLKCQMVVLRVDAGNSGMCSIARRFGFDPHVIPRLMGRDSPGVVFTLTDDQWRAHRLYKNSPLP